MGGAAMLLKAMPGGFGGFDPGGSARSNVERTHTYRRTGGGGSGGGSSGNGWTMAAILIVVGLCYLLSRIL